MTVCHCYYLWNRLEFTRSYAMTDWIFGVATKQISSPCAIGTSNSKNSGSVVGDRDLALVFSPVASRFALDGSAEDQRSFESWREASSG